LEDANRELSQAKGQLEESAAVRLRFSYVVAHELRNLLQRFSVAVELLQQESANNKLIATTNSEIRDMSVLLEQLRDYSLLLAHRKPVTAERFELAALHEELMAMYGPQAAAKGLTLKADCRFASLSIISDRIIIKQIAANLLSNAIGYTGQGEATLTFSVHEDDRWMLMVSDTGKGVAPFDHRRLFDEFDRPGADEMVTGSGIGLTVARELVALLGGTLNIISQLDLGTRCEVVLPRWNKATKQT